MSWLTRDKLLFFEEFNIVKNELLEFKKLWYNSIWFLWWEPAIHPNFLEIIRFANSLEFYNIEVISNWTKFDNKEFLLRAINNWLTRISISLHSIISGQEELLTWWIKWVLKIKLESIKNILYYYNKWFLKKELSINIVITKINYKVIKKTILYLYKIWVN